jgi:hypothetical protein
MGLDFKKPPAKRRYLPQVLIFVAIVLIGSLALADERSAKLSGEVTEVVDSDAFKLHDLPRCA